MALSMYGLTVPVMLRGFAALSTYLGAAEQFMADNHIDPSVLLHARLAPDMMDFTAQIHRATTKAARGD
jgi:hypothetical protein